VQDRCLTFRCCSKTPGQQPSNRSLVGGSARELSQAADTEFLARELGSKATLPNWSTGGPRRPQRFGIRCSAYGASMSKS
jgi:hypothetical protein